MSSYVVWFIICISQICSLKFLISQVTWEFFSNFRVEVISFQNGLMTRKKNFNLGNHGYFSSVQINSHVTY